MKKFKMLCLMMAMAFLFSACGNGGQNAAGEEGGQNAAGEETGQNAAEEAVSPSTEESLADNTNAGAGIEEAQEEVTIRIGAPKAPPTLAILYMMENHTLGDNVTIELDVWDAPEQLIAMVQDGNHDMFAYPLTVVAKLYNKGIDVRLMNVNTWGVTYFVTTDETLTDWSQLKGKTVYVPLQSSPPDALTQFFLNEAGLTVGEDVEIIYASTAEVAQMISAGKIEYATLIEPQVTAAQMNNEQVRVAFSFEEEWQKVTGDDSLVPNAGFGTTKRFMDEQPWLTAQFNKAYEEALNWVTENPAEAGALAEKHLGLKAAVVEKAIPTMGLLYKSAADVKEELDVYYRLLADFEPTMIGGKIPDETMYYTE